MSSGPSRVEWIDTKLARVIVQPHDHSSGGIVVKQFLEKHRKLSMRSDRFAIATNSSGPFRLPIIWNKKNDRVTLFLISEYCHMEFFLNLC